jgi:hypothetical protein
VLKNPNQASVGAVYDRAFLLESTKIRAVIDRAYNAFVTIFHPERWT